MIINKNAITLFLVAVFFSIGNSYGQFTSKWSAEMGLGGALMYGDLKNKPITFGSHVGLNYHINPFVSAGIQGQFGRLKGSDASGRNADSRYAGANMHGRLHLGQFMPSAKNYSYYKLTNKSFWSYLVNLYVGAGLGFIYADIDAYREGGSAAEVYAGSDYVYEMVLPISFGIDIPFDYQLNGPRWAVNVNYQLGLSFGDNLDGYTNSYSAYQDRMVYFALGIKRILIN